MARSRKVHVKDFGPRRYASRATTLHVEVNVSRESHSRSHAFQACATIQKSGVRRASKHPVLFERRNACAYGPAPRRAIAAALKKLGTTMIKRSSAFRGAQ